MEPVKKRDRFWHNSRQSQPRICVKCQKDITKAPHFIDKDNRLKQGHKATLCPQCAIEHNIIPNENYQYASRQNKSAQLHIRLKGKGLNIHPEFIHDFVDEESMDEFLRNLHDDECGIIEQHGNSLQILRALKTRADADAEDTAKSLEMEG